MKVLILLLFPILLLSQSPCTNDTSKKVGINVGECPTTTLDVGGNLRVRDILLKSNKYVLLTDEEGNLTKILLSDLFTTTPDSKCPQFIPNGSGPYFIRFKGGGYVTNPNDPIKVNGLRFNGAGTYVVDNITYYTYTNVSGQPLDLTNFSVLFSTHQCNYN